MGRGKLDSLTWILIGIGILVLVGGGTAIMVTGGGLSGIINTIALAIQKAEGWIAPNAQYPKGSWSYRTNNPGNITDIGYPGQTGTAVGPSGITFPVFDSYADGFAALVAKLTNIFNGNSATYSPDMSLSQFFQTYSGDQSEANNVAQELGVDPSTTLVELAASAVSSDQA